MTRLNPLLIHFSLEFLKIKSLSKAGRSRIDSRNNRRIINKLQLSGIYKGMFQNNSYFMKMGIFSKNTSL